jgi:hypothetical protein
MCQAKTIAGREVECAKRHYFNDLAAAESSSAKAGLGSGDTFSAEITVQRVDGCVEYEVTVRARFQMALDLNFDGLGEPSL